MLYNIQFCQNHVKVRLPGGLGNRYKIYGDRGWVGKSCYRSLH